MIANIVQSRDSVGSGEEESRVHYVVLRLFMFVCLFVCLFSFCVVMYLNFMSRRNNS